MGADANASTLGMVLFGKTRRAVLALTFGKPEEAFYVRQVARYAATGNGVVQRELEQLASCGILTRRVSGRQVYFQANSGCPIYQELRALVVKTTGVADLLREALAPIADRVSFALIYGSFAAGRQGERSDVDVLVVGEVAFAEVVEALAPAQERIGREVNPTVYSPADFQSKVAARHHFLVQVLGGSKILLIGEIHELEGLAAKRVAGRARSKRCGDRGEPSGGWHPAGCARRGRRYGHCEDDQCPPSLPRGLPGRAARKGKQSDPAR